MKAVQQYFEEMKCNSGGGDDDSKYPSIDIFIHFGVSGNSIMYELEERAKNEKTFRARDEQGEQPLNEPINEDLPIDSFLHCNLTTHLNSIIESVNLKLHENSLHPPLSQLVLESARDKLRRINMTGTLGGVKSTKNALSSNPNEDFIQKQLEELRTDLQESLSLITNAGAFCKASQDAGLFICNYCYYHSLQYSTCGDVSRNGLDYNNKKDEMQKKSQRKCYSLFVHVPPHNVIPVKVQVEFVKTLLQVIVESL
nr:unnamed protein product [Naegleria fowleri]